MQAMTSRKSQWPAPVRSAIMFVLAAAFVFAAGGAGVAKSKDDAATARAAATTGLAVPDANTLTLLVRSSVLSLNDAIETGNFTVLRDKGTPAFRARYSAAHLSATFLALVAARTDLSNIAVAPIKLAEAPAIDADNRLRVRGSFATLAGNFNLDLLFEPVGNHWRIAGIAVLPTDAVAAAPPVPAKNKKRRTAENRSSKKSKK